MEVTPSNKPEAINHHFVGDNKGNWVKRPGRIDATICGRDEKDVASEINDIVCIMHSCLNQPLDNKIMEKFDNCRRKLYAVRYHKMAIENEIAQRVIEFKRNYNAGSGVKFETENDTLIYNTEAFLLQVKSSLDLLVHGLDNFYPELRSHRTFKHTGEGENYRAGGKIIDDLLKRGRQGIADLFETNRRDWIQEMTRMRDKITHYSRLKGFKCFVEEPYTGEATVKIHYPSMPTGEQLDVYCNKIYNCLLSLYKDIFNLVKNEFAKNENSVDPTPKSPS